MGATVTTSSDITLITLQNCPNSISYLHGLLEQISAQKLQEKCRACLQLTVDDASRAALALEQRLGTRDYEVLPGNVLRLYDFLERPQVVAATLAETKVALLGLESRSANLEDYFLSLIGGVHHG